MSETKASSWLKPSLDWLLIFVPIAIALRFIPSLENPTALFIVSCLAIIPLAGWMGKATEHFCFTFCPTRITPRPKSSMRLEITLLPRIKR